MRLFFLSMLIMLLYSSVNMGQSNIYRPFPDSNAFWGDRGRNLFNPLIDNDTRYALNGDTLINSTTYHKVYSLFDSTLFSPYSAYFAGIREQNKKVYMIKGALPEHLLYDFGMSAGDTINFDYSMATNSSVSFSRVLTKIDSILLRDGKYRKCFIYDPVGTGSTSDSVVEGIGSIVGKGLFNPLIDGWCTCGDVYRFTCFKQNDTAFYLNNPDCNHCFCTLLTPVNELTLNSQAKVFPNPLNSEAIIKMNSPLQNGILEIYNSQGQVQKKTINVSGNSITIKKENMHSGIYFVKITEAGKVVFSEKIIVTD